MTLLIEATMTPGAMAPSAWWVGARQNRPVNNTSPG
jgi:hypothetical protein